MLTFDSVWPPGCSQGRDGYPSVPNTILNKNYVVQNTNCISPGGQVSEAVFTQENPPHTQISNGKASRLLL